MEDIPRSKILNGHNGDDVGLTQSFAGGDGRLIIHCETLASQVPTDVSEDGVTAGNSRAMGAGAYSGASRESTDSYLVTVDIISAGKKCGSVRYPLVLVGNLNGVLKHTSFYQAME